jgi:pantothenate kinase
VADNVCKIVAKLAHDVADAVAKVYKARGRLDTAKGDKADTSPHIVALAGARKAGRSAIAALEQHKKEHGCQGVSASRRF